MGRIVYGLEWDIPKFEKAFPLMNNAGSLCSAGKPKVLTSGKIVAGDGIGRKSAWYENLIFLAASEGCKNY